MTIYDGILHQLNEGEAQTLAQILASLPELAAEPHGPDVLRLLLRLDRRLRPLDDGRWTLATTPQTPEQRIVASAKAYLDSLPGGGALLDSVVTRVVSETNYALDTVRSVVLRYFVNNGRVVRNQLKETLSR
jgi:hypothetical protein